nr:alpha/beta hydrolase [Actinoplanes derwentensis]
MSTVSRRTVLAGTAAAAAAVAVTGSPASASGSRVKPTIVLVHGAFADAGGWSGVLERLIRAGYPVIAPANPLRGVASDSAYLASLLATVSGPIVLAAHSYGGVVITNAALGNPNVKALVYVAAFAPDAGDDVFHLQTRFEGTELTLDALDFRPHPGGVDGYVKREYFHRVFAGDLPRTDADLLWATQRPGDASTLQTPSGEPAWKTIPSWFLVARDDKLIPAQAQHFMAARAQAKATIAVRASHVVHISQPKAVADLIEKAAR